MPDKKVDPEEAAIVVDAFYQAYKRGEGGLKNVPGLLLRIINEELWRCRKIKTGKIKTFDKFKDFVTTEPPEGLGENVDMLKNLCRDHEEARLALARVTSEELGEHGGDHTSKEARLQCNVANDKQGNTQDYLLSRLKRDAPEVAEDYFNGKYKSVRQAAIAAGIVREQTPFQKAMKEIEKVKDQDEIYKLIEALQAKTGNQLQRGAG